MKSFLEFQIDQKKFKLAEMKKEEKDYMNEVKNSVERFNHVEKENEKKKREELMKYKQGLEMQLKDKNLSN